MTSYLELLRKTAEARNSIVCFGIDPILEKIPVSGKDTKKKIVNFYSEILEEIENEIGAVKPNYAFFSQYGWEGLRALEKIISIAKKKGIPVILDAKRGDIGKSSEAYSKEVFEFWKADATTVSPYMGTDSVLPFITKSKGAYVLVRTSNQGASDLQQLQLKNNKEVFMQIAAKVTEWGAGAVVGATNLQELEKIARFFASAGKETPLLIPGVGAQGGSASEVASILRKTGKDIRIHRINSSSGISYAYEKSGTKDYVGAAEKAVTALNREIGRIG